MMTLNSVRLILAVTIIGLAGISLAAIASLLVQSASATTDMMIETVGGRQEPSNPASTTSAINNNNSNAVLGSLSLTGEDTLTSFNRINESYTEFSYAGNRTITSPDSTPTATINATALLVDLNGITPDDPRSSTGVAFFSTNSTGQLAFLDNMVAIHQVKASQKRTTIEYWKWKGADPQN